ncbi:hypothetical protein AgCh_028071 [Apium graveolens]
MTLMKMMFYVYRNYALIKKSEEADESSYQFNWRALNKKWNNLECVENIEKAPKEQLDTNQLKHKAYKNSTDLVNAYYEKTVPVVKSDKSSRPKRTIYVPKSPPRRRRRIILRDKSDEEEQVQVPVSKPVTVEAEKVIFQKEVEAKEIKEEESRCENTQAQYEDAEEGLEGDHESLISLEPIVIEVLSAPEDNVPDTVITPPISPFKESATVEDSGLSPEIDIHRLHIPTVLYLEAPQAKELTPHVSPLNIDIPTTPFLDLDPETDEVVPESPSAKHTLVLSEDEEMLSSPGDSAPVNAPILGKEALLKFVEEDASVPCEETHRGIEWTKKWNEPDFIPSLNILKDHISKADELLTNYDFKTQLKVTALSTKSLQGLHSTTEAKVDKLQDTDDKLDMEIKLDKKRFIRPIQEKVEAIEKVQEKKQAQLDEVLQNQAAQQIQLTEIQSSVELLLSLLLTDDAKKGEKVVKSKCSTSQTLKKKDDSEDDQGNPSKGKGQVQSNKVSSQKLISDSSKSSTQKNTSSEAVNAQVLMIKGRETTVYYKEPKIQTLDEEITRRLFLIDNLGMDLETLKEEEARFAVEKINLKSKASNAKKPPRPKEKGIVIKERSTSEASKPKTRSQVKIDPKAKGKGKIDEPTKKQEMKITQILMNHVCKMVQVFDDTAAEDETVETLKRKKINEESKTTSDIAQVVQSEYISE